MCGNIYLEGFVRNARVVHSVVMQLVGQVWRPVSPFFVCLFFVFAWSIICDTLTGRIRAMNMRCYRKKLRISYKDHVANEESLCQDPAGNQTTWPA